DVVDKQDVKVAVATLELLGAAGTKRRDELVGEPLGGGVAHAEAGGVGVQVVGDRAKQVGLAETRRSVQKERVVGLRWGLRDGQRGGVSQAVPLADHEALECVVGVELDGGDAGHGSCPPSSLSGE